MSAPTPLRLGDLAEFTGSHPDRYAAFFTEAHAQAVDLLLLATSREELPAFEGLTGRVVRRGVLAMIESLCEFQASREMRFSPFKTETIGSYTYSLQEKALAGVPTGISWFDIAVGQLTTGESITSASISVFDRPGDLRQVEGRPQLPGPADLEVWPPARDGSYGYPGQGSRS